MAEQSKIEVFSTQIATTIDANTVESVIKAHFPELRVTFDLEDCDRILRIEAPDTALNMPAIEDVLSSLPFEIQVLNK